MNRSQQKIWMGLTIALLAVYAVLSGLANSDLIDGRFALFMDEKVTYDGVQKIIHPESFRSFLYNIYNGADHRYGRSLWNSIAFFSFIPAWLFGTEGQIIAGRMTQVLFLAASFILLSVVFTRDWKYRFLLVGALIAMPFTGYYSTMPKPEPIQLFFIALFLYHFKKCGLQLGLFYWIYLGAAFGSKISALPLVVVLFAGSLFAEYIKNGRPFTAIFDRAVGSLGYFLAGLVFAVPMLFLPVFAAIFCYWLITRILVRTVRMQGQKLYWLKTALLVMIPVLLIAYSYLTYRNGGKTAIASWGGAVMANSKNASDLQNIGFLAWGKYFFSEWLVAPVWFAALFVVFAGLLVADRLRTFWTQWRQVLHAHLFLYTVMAAGGALCISIMISVHRLWGFYLFTGAALVVSALVSLLEENMMNNATGKMRTQKLMTIGTACLLVVLVFAFWAPAGFRGYLQLSRRTDSEDYRKQYRSYLVIDSLLSRRPESGNPRPSAMVDPSLFLPEKSPVYTITEIWKPFTDWEKGPDVIILGPRHVPSGIPVSSGSVQYDQYLREQAGYAKHVITGGGVCAGKICYTKYRTLPDGSEILMLTKQKTDDQMRSAIN